MMPRPTKYLKTFPETIDKYVQECITNSDVPWIEEVARILGVDTATVWRWGKKHEEFCNAIKKLMDRQALSLKIMGLKGNATMAIFLLKNNHRYIEAEKTQHKNKVGTNVVHLYPPPREKGQTTQ